MRAHVGRRVGAAGYGSGRVGYWLADDVEGLAAPVEIGFVSGALESDLPGHRCRGYRVCLAPPADRGVLSTARDVSRE